MFERIFNLFGFGKKRKEVSALQIEERRINNEKLAEMELYNVDRMHEQNDANVFDNRRAYQVWYNTGLTDRMRKNLNCLVEEERRALLQKVLYVELGGIYRFNTPHEFYLAIR